MQDERSRQRRTENEKNVHKTFGLWIFFVALSLPNDGIITNNVEQNIGYMKKISILITAVALMMSLSAGAQTDGNNGKDDKPFFVNQTIKEKGKYVTSTMQVEDFDRIMVSGSINVEFMQRQERPSVEVFTSKDVLPALEIEVSGTTLNIGFKKGFKVKYKQLLVRVNSPIIRGISLAGSGEVRLVNHIKTDRLTLSMMGSGDIVAGQVSCKVLNLSVKGSGDISVREANSSLVDASVAGSGDIELGGKTKNANFTIAGSGDIDAERLDADDVKSAVAGSGGISLKKKR